MQVSETGIPGLRMIRPQVFRDARGYFTETYNLRRYCAADIDIDWVQDNQSASRRGTLRGLHYQVNQPQDKLVRVIEGRVFDVAVDIRPDSATFGQWHALILDDVDLVQFLIPQGFAHGFQVLSDRALFAYKCSDYYSPEDERGIVWNDPDLAIDWPIADPHLSEKDGLLPRLHAIERGECRMRRR